MDRRRFLQASAALAVSPAALAQARFAAYPFTLGVASGYPSPYSVVLWTRLMGELEPLPIQMRWEVAADEAMRRIVASGTTTASPGLAHSARVEVQGLEPARWYWYRFTAGDAQSPKGRTRTAPPRHAETQQLRFAFASCQQYEHGYFGAYRHIVADDPELLVFLGDYIYEGTWGRELVRNHNAPDAVTLEDYRARYALYKSDPDLQAAHAACPWIATWDDHEVVNDYANDRVPATEGQDEFLARREAAYRAYFEHMPLPPRMLPRGPFLPLYASLDWGNLARFYMLDDRQYRSAHACERQSRRGGGSGTFDIAECPEIFGRDRTMLGAAQERWLDGALAASPAAWNVLGQQTRMAQFDQKPGPGRSAWTDGWDGYPAARRRLMESLVARRTRNPVVIGGDVHAFSVAQLKINFDDPASPTIATEFVGTSITSYGPPQERMNRLLPENPHIQMIEGRYRGYVRVDVVPGRWTAALRAMDTARVREAPCHTLATYVVENGKPGTVRG